MNFKLSHKFKKEEEFSSQLAENLQDAKIKYGDKTTYLETQHNIKKGKRRIPDITLSARKPVKMEHRLLTDPFYIECKLGNENRKPEEKSSYSHLLQIRDNLNQILRYKYKRKSSKLKDLQKYGDYHVAVTTPQLLRETPDKSVNSGYINFFQQIRTLWKLGIGLMYREEDGSHVISFNQSEVVTVER